MALAEAKLRAEQVGQQNQQMTAIAHEARILADLYVHFFHRTYVISLLIDNITNISDINLL